jgi:hypothetical protein
MPASAGGLLRVERTKQLRFREIDDFPFLFVSIRLFCF